MMMTTAVPSSAAHEGTKTTHQGIPGQAQAQAQA